MNEAIDSPPAEGTLIGLAFTSPIAGQYGMMASGLFSAWVTTALERVNAGPSGPVSFFAPLFMSLTLNVMDRNLAIRELERLLKGAHPSGHWTLAWFDGAEGIWRNQAKADAPDFEHFRRREALQAARDYMWSHVTEVLSKFAEIDGKSAPNAE